MRIVIWQRGYYGSIENSTIIAFGAIALFSAAGCMHLLKQSGKHSPHQNFHKQWLYLVLCNPLYFGGKNDWNQLQLWKSSTGSLEGEQKRNRDLFIPMKIREYLDAVDGEKLCTSSSVQYCKQWVKMKYLVFSIIISVWKDEFLCIL